MRPILETHCFGCHGPQKQDGQRKISSLDLDIVKGADAEHWQEVLDRLNAGTMPPRGKSKLSAGEREQLTSWLTGQLKLAAEMRRSNGGRSVLRRLTRYEYNNTLRDLLGVDIDFARDLPPEGAAELGFQNNSNVLVTSTLHLDHFQKVSDQFPHAVGIKKTAHKISHERANYQQWSTYSRFLTEQFAYFLHRLKSTPDGNGSLLDNTMILFGCCTSATHVSHTYPLILAGGGNLGIRHGRFRKYGESVPLSNLFVTMLDRMQVPVRSFKDSTGELRDILA